MRGRLNKLIALFWGLVFLSAITLTTSDVNATAVADNTVTIGAGEMLTITEDSSKDYILNVGSELIIDNGANVTGDISFTGYGKVTVNKGCSIRNIYAKDVSGKLINNGIVYGQIAMFVDVENNESGIIKGSMTQATNTVTTNKGMIEGNVIVRSAVSFQNKGTINNLEMINATVQNDGTVGNCTISGEAGTCSIEMGRTSNITNLNCAALSEGYYITVKATDGAIVKNATVHIDSLSEEGSSGKLAVTNALNIKGSKPVHNVLDFVVRDATVITKEVSSGIGYVYYNGGRYTLPTQAMTGKTMRDLYNLNASKSSIAFSDMKVLYGEEDITAAMQTITYNNSGSFNMNCRIKEIPEFVEVYYGAVKLTTGDIISIHSGSQKKISIKIKAGKLAGEYLADLSIEKWTDVGMDAIDENLVDTDVISVKLKVNRLEGQVDITVADINYGEEVNPVVSSTTNGMSSKTIKYKKKGADDSAYTVIKPRNAGEYTAQVTFAQTTNYEAVTKTADFKIHKVKGVGTITVDDIYYGNTPKPQVTSETNGIADVTIEYKKSGADDNTYSTIVPGRAGKYVARATFAPTTNYKAVIATSNFSISYIPIPDNPYKISGVTGDRNYYISDVTITPAPGYMIAESSDGTYKKSLTIRKSKEIFNVYLKSISNNGKTAGIKMPSIKIDKSAPEIYNAPVGGKVYADKLEIKVQDDNLAQVLVNDEKINIKNDMVVLNLVSDGGEETYDIICTDEAGNTSKKKITVAAKWLENKKIPSATKVKLRADCAYHLTGGTWKVEGDGTVYEGNNSFYVEKEGEYLFTKVH